MHGNCGTAIKHISRSYVLVTYTINDLNLSALGETTNSYLLQKRSVICKRFRPHTKTEAE